MKACIFDMDGTLVDSLTYWGHGIYEAIKSFGDYENIEGTIMGVLNDPVKFRCPYFVNNLGMDTTPEELWDRIEEIMEKHYRNDVKLIDGVYEYLCDCKAKNIPMAVVSATEKKLVGACLEAMGISDMFEFYLSCEDYGVGKEDPAIFLDAAKKLGFEPHDICLFDDSLVSLQTAHSCGFITVGIAERYNNKNWEKVLALADGYITDWREGIKENSER